MLLRSCCRVSCVLRFFFFFQAEDGIRDVAVTGVQTCALPIYHAWHANGRAGLKAAGRVGRRPKLGPKQLATIERALRAGPRGYGFSTDLWTLPRVAIVIERLTRGRHHPGHVWRILRGLNCARQRPPRRARERDEAAIAQWKTRRWAQLKKKPAASGPGSSSKTKAASRSSPSSAAPGPRGARRRS